MKLAKKIHRVLIICLATACALVFCSSALALEPSEIALVVNRNVPEGLELAKFYAQARHIPDNRILILDLPKSDQISCKEFEDHIVPQVRDFLHTAQLETKVKCLVTFYGVPLRIDPRVNTSEETAELQAIQRQLLSMSDQIRPSIESIEALVKTINADFAPDPLGSLDQLLKRKTVAFREFGTALAAIPDKTHQAELITQFYTLAEPLMGDKARIEKQRLTPAAVQTDPALALQKSVQAYNDLIEQATPLEKTPNDPQARRKLRDIASSHFGLTQYLSLLRDQADYLDPTQSDAAFDSELAMVQWNVYTHKSFMTNPLHYTSKTKTIWPTMMVSRLDAPEPQTVKAMIENSIKVENEGLKGQIVIDSLGVKPGEESESQKGYGGFDEYLRDLNKILSNQNKLTVLLDQKPQVLPAGSASDVALYVGWYSVHNYIPSCKFNPGAVGYHVASYELISLRQPGENGWVHGLLNDGVVGTLGPVAEPFLGTFPRPDEYFPLLLTGQLSLAEVYWKTTPAVSWMMTCVGDPLYTPYRQNPVLTRLDLPFRLRAALPDVKTP